MSARKGFSFTVPVWRFAVSTGRWDQFAKPGDFEKDGARVVFDERTLGQMIDNFASRQNDLGMDHDHQALNAATNGQAAPALAWYSAMALISGGKVAKFATHDATVQPPDAAGMDDGLYGYRAEITPIGEKLLPGYRYISPAFAVEGVNERGESVGYDLLNVAATNVPFLDGMAPIQMHRFGAIAPPNLGAPDGAKPVKETKMDEKLMKKFGIADGATDEDKKAALKKFAAACVTKMANPDAPAEEIEKVAKDLLEVAEHIEGEAGENFKKFAHRFDQTEPHGTASGEAQHNGMAATEDAEKVAMSATLRATTDRLARLEAAEAARVAQVQVEQFARADQLAADAIAGGYPTADKAALVAFARSNFDAAQNMVRPFLTASGRLFSATARGADARPAAGNDIEERRTGGYRVIKYTRGLSAMAKARAAKDNISFERALDLTVAEKPELYKAYLENLS